MGLILTAAACGSGGATGARGGTGGGGTGGGGGAVGSGGQGGGGTVSTSCDLSRPFNAPVQVVPNTSMSSEGSASVSADGLTAVVTSQANSNISAFRTDVYSRSTVTAMFGNPQPLVGDVTNLFLKEPRLTRDGLSLFFDDFAPSLTNIWLSTRASVTDPFNGASRLPAQINNGTESSYGAWVSSDGGRLYFQRNHVLYVSTITAGQFGAPAPVNELNAGGTVLFAVLTDDELTIYFASERDVPPPAVSSPAFRVWTSRRAGRSAPWGAPSFVSELDDGDSMVPTDVSPDGYLLYVDDVDGSSTYRIKQAAKPPL